MHLSVVPEASRYRVASSGGVDCLEEQRGQWRWLMEAHLQTLPSLRACVATEISSLKQSLQAHNVAQSAVGGSRILILDFLVHKAMFV